MIVPCLPHVKQYSSLLRVIQKAGQHAQLHTPSARDHLNFLLVQGAGDLVGATSGTVTGDLTFDQILDRALKLKDMGKIKDFGL